MTKGSYTLEEELERLWHVERSGIGDDVIYCFDTKWLIFQAVMWRTSVVAAARIVGAGLAGSWAIGLLVLVGQVTGEVSGPSTILALLIAAITAVLTGDLSFFTLVSIVTHGISC